MQVTNMGALLKIFTGIFCLFWMWN